MSDKHKISLFDESKFEDNTVEKESVKKRKHREDSKNIEIVHGESEEDEGDDEDEDEDDFSSEDNPNIFIKIGERDSMVLVGDTAA